MIKKTTTLTELRRLAGLIKEDDAMNDEARELELFIMNDEQLYRQQFMAIVNNFKRKMKRGVYDHDKAPKAVMYLVDNAARKYVKMHAATTARVQDIFPKETRLMVANKLADSIYSDIKAGEYDEV
tara:strand:- start:744 stop:1121 length:378 start_codon:yes stop_codon:yes gene_type:complete